VFEQRLAEAWLGFVADTTRWLRIRSAHGSEAVERVYREALAGSLDPRDGHVLTMSVPAP
jgi:hypothetical protein